MRRVMIATSVLVASGSSSCLLGRSVPFTDDGLPPVTPPAIMDTAEGFPRPNSIVVVDQTTAGQPARQEFRARVYEPNERLDLQARFFLNRPRPCTPNIDCTRPLDFAEQRVTRIDEHVWEVAYPVTFTTPGTCNTVDLYVTSDFAPQSAGQRADTQSARTGDLAHSRWIVWVRPVGNTDPPSLTGCPRIVPPSNEERR